MNKKGHEKTVVLEVESGTKKWLDSLSEAYWDMDVGEAGFPEGVLTKGNEPGAYGIGNDVLDTFNSKIKKVTIK